MTGAYQADGDQTAPAEAAGNTDAADLVAQIRQLAGHDPAGVQQVVAEVLAALDRASGGALREQLPSGLPLADEAAGPPARFGSGEDPVEPLDLTGPADPR